MNLVKTLAINPLRQLPKNVLLGGLSLLLILAILVYMWQNYQPATNNLPVSHVDVGDIVSNVTATGQIDVDQSLNVRTTTNGRIIDLVVEPGSKVKSGDVLAKLDGYELAKQNYDAAQAKVNQLKEAADLAQQKVALAQQQSPAVQAQLLVDQAAIAAAAKQVESSKINAEDAQQSYQAAISGNETQKQVAKAEYNKAKMAVEIQKKLVDQATKKLELDRSSSSTATSVQLEMDQQSINVASTQLDIANQLVKSLQNQLYETTSSSNTATNVAIQSAKSAMDQAIGNVSQLELQLSQAQKKLNDDTTNGLPADTLADDQNSVTYLTQQLTNARQLATDATDQYHLTQAQSSSAQSTVQTTLDQAKGSVLINQALLDQAKSKLNTDKRLAESNTVLNQDDEQIKNAELQLQSAQQVLADAEQMYHISGQPDQTTIASARANLDQVKGSLSVNEAMLEQAKAKLTADNLPPDKREIVADQQAALQALIQMEETQVELIKAKMALDQVQLVSTVDGVIVDVAKKVGDTIVTNEELCQIMPDHPKHRIFGLIPAGDVAKVKAGSHVAVESSQFSDQLEGTVKFISPVPVNKGIDSTTNPFQYQVYVDVDNLPDNVRSGMSVHLKIESSTKKNIKRVPAEAVMEKDGEQGVYVQNPDKKTQFDFKTIKMGTTDDKYVEVENLSAGTVVALKKP